MSVYNVTFSTREGNQNLRVEAVDIPDAIRRTNVLFSQDGPCRRFLSAKKVDTHPSPW